MTDKKRILPWKKETDDEKYQWLNGDISEDGFRACTMWSDYIAYPRLDGNWGWAHLVADGEYWDANGVCEHADAALDACEKDYTSRCTEFLRVAGPGEVVVPIKVAIDAHDTAISSRHFWVKFADMLARFDNAINGLSAAIDAASKE